MLGRRRATPSVVRGLGYLRHAADVSHLNAKAAAALSATLLLWGCERQDSQNPLLKPIQRARIATPSGPVVPASDWRAQIRDAYRLRPDARFLLALGEIDRLAGPLPAPPGKAATAEFAGGKWSVRCGEVLVGSLPEFPDFPDFLPLLVAHAKAVLPRGSNAMASPAPAGQDAFLMPGLLKPMQLAERFENDPSFRGASRCFARLAFQMPDRLEIAPLIPARALALLAAVRSRDARAGVEEEILLAHALGYTRHAETLAATLPSNAPLRAFETVDGQGLREMAAQRGATEEVRYLAVKRSTSVGDLKHWKQARERFMQGNDSVAVIATGLEIELPNQVEVTDKRVLLSEALPRAVLRELSRMPVSVPAGFEAVSEFDVALEGAADAARGALWDGPAVRAYYEAADFAPFETGFLWPTWMMTADAGTGAILRDLSRDDRTVAPDPRGDTRGAAVLILQMRNRYQRAPPATPQRLVEIRALTRWLDTRPSHRFELAGRSGFDLQDPRAAEDFYRSVLQVTGEEDRRMRAEAALYLGDWATLRRILDSPELTAPEATAILWNWYGSRFERDRLEAEYDRLIERFPNDWNATNYFIDLLRDRKEYRKACEIVERWRARNTDPRTPGYYHAHIRLAHNYVLAGEYEKGRLLLDRLALIEPFEKGNRERGMAECLVGLGRLPEAEKMAREAVRALPNQSEAARILVRILWREGKDSEAVDLLAGKAISREPWERCQALDIDFSEVFADLPRKRLEQAVEAIAKKPELANTSPCVIRGLARSSRWEDALWVTDRLLAPSPERMDVLIDQYGYMKNWKGREAAAAWLTEKLPAEKRNPLSMKALYTKNDDLLWDVIATPIPSDHPEWVWLFRAVAFALRGSDADPHRSALLGYYEKSDPDPYHVMGRYLVGLATEEDMFALARSGRPRSEIAYYLGVRAQGEKRFRDACEWYRVSAESGEGTSPRALAFYTLGEWTGLRQGIWAVEAGGAAKSQ